MCKFIRGSRRGGDMGLASPPGKSQGYRVPYRCGLGAMDSYKATKATFNVGRLACEPTLSRF